MNIGGILFFTTDDHREKGGCIWLNSGICTSGSETPLNL